MADKPLVTTAGSITVATITITDPAAKLSALISASIPTGKSLANLLQATLLGQVTAGTSRGAVLYGGSGTLGYIAEGVEKTFVVRGGDVYLKRAGGADVTAQIELCWF